jgi:hypothetical protein
MFLFFAVLELEQACLSFGDYMRNFDSFSFQVSRYETAVAVFWVGFKKRSQQTQ